MINNLSSIVSQKQLEVNLLKNNVNSQANHPLATILHGDNIKTKKSFKNVLRAKTLSVIAEIKRQSPSKGLLAEINNPVSLAKKYVQGGAKAISVLTDKQFFNGSLEDLSCVAQALKQSNQPLLRKDFIIDEIQIAEAIHAGADAVLAIVTLLGAKTETILHAARRMNIDVLVEVHDQAELDLALAAGAEIIGVNNRNLNTFVVDTQQAFRLIDHIPDHIITVAESGINESTLAQAYHLAGLDAVLIGEALVKHLYPQQFIRACHDE